MNRLLAYLGRFAIILLGFVCACIASSMAMHVLSVGSFDLSRYARGEFWFWIVFNAALLANVAFLPALVVVVIAEIMALRGWLGHALCGGAIGLYSTFALRAIGGLGNAGPPDADFLMIMTATGMVGGLVYWLVAGRSAGIAIGRVATGRMP